MSSRARLRFLGSGDAFGSGGRLQTSILLETDDFRGLIDCGATVLIGLKRAGIDPASIDVIVISHLHGDHFGGIPFFLLDAQFSRRLRPLVVAGPPGTAERLTQAMEVLFPGSSQVKRKFETRVVELTAETATNFGPLKVTPFEVVHASGAPSFALRLSLADRVVAYSGDTEWTDALIKASKDSDLFICEAYFYEKLIPFHLDFRTLMEHRGEIRAKRLIVTHMSEDMLGRLDALDVDAAWDGQTIELKATELDDSASRLVVVVAQTGGDSCVTRSHAKRIMARCDHFREVVLDFDGVSTIGPSFADEIFRVWSRAFPDTTLIPIRMEPEVEKMVRRALAHDKGLPGDLESGNAPA